MSTAVLAVLAVLGLTIFASAAGAKGGGQLESWGAKGTGNGQFLLPGMLGVDPSNGTVYSGDMTSGKTNYRIQQFSPSGEFKASVTIPRVLGTEIIGALHGIAVDPGLERFYVIEGCKTPEAATNCKKTSAFMTAKQILVYSTKAEAGKLVPDKTVPAIALPTGANQLYYPQSIAVDPSNHDLVVLAENAAHQDVIQRFSSAGVAKERFVDTTKKLRPAGGERPVAGTDAVTLVVAPNGVSYTLTGNPSGINATRAWQLPSDLSKVELVSGFAEAAEKEDWVAKMSSAPEEFLGGSQLALSADGSTLYWKEKITRSEPTEAGNMLVRGFSLTKNATTALWGNGSSSCKITTTNSGIAAAPSGKLVVFDYGPASESPGYGVKVVTFGPAGTGCPEPIAKFTVNGKKEGEEPTGIKPGDTVTFDAASSELLGGFRKELIWKFGDGTEKTVKFTPGEEEKEAVTTVTHVYSSAAKVTVRLEIKLREAVMGSPEPVERTFTVGTPATPKFKLKVVKGGSGSGTVTSTPPGIECGFVCEFEFDEGKKVTLSQTAGSGSEFKGWGGACSGTGTCEVTISAAKEVTATFDLEKHLLTVAKTGTGTGTVSGSPGSINCGVVCSGSFDHGTVVTLAATADGGSEFSGWSGACAGTGSCEVTVDAAKEVGAAFTLSGGGEEGTGLYCDEGVDATGAGSALQLAPHGLWATGFGSEVCPGGASVSYETGAGIPQWTGTIDHDIAFVGSDEAPTAAQIAAIKSAAGVGVQLAVIPVAQTAVAVIANVPAGCTVEEVTSGDLAAVFEGRFTKWSQLDSAEGSCGSAITRVVPKDAEGATTQLKSYLFQLNKKALACAPGKATWQGLQATNTVWPESCPEKTLSPLTRPASDGGAAEVAAVNATAGAIGFATLPDAQAGSADTLRLQNNGYAPLGEATFAPASAGAAANCSDMTYKTPVGGGGLDLDWSAVSGGRPAIGGGAYPLCMLTYVLAFHGYEAAGFSVGQERTAKDYINGLVVQPAGQVALASAGFAALPGSGAPRSDVLGEARKAAGKIIR
ncbi:MAG TPA: substrate-binding domain-containing protein [Solirubrobacterales bacterium]|nr:substrate-binding domain-containing protein [Solirubrobacterales bacterium]